ncbi:MAG: V-type ATP synthase subunit A, partial [Planctomycetia bacterium]|nr:V-type ATP synthase subunit A [Planctomycetia bacterium]
MDSNSQKSMGRVVRISGPLVIAEDLPTARMYDVVRVGDQRLFGEIIEIHGNKYSIQVYEETEGLRPGAPVEPTGMPLTVELGPGLISTIYDGLQRPLEALRAEQGDYILRGAELPALDPRKKWRFEPTAEAGADVQPGDIIGTVAETQVVQQRILVPQGVTGKLVHIAAGEYTVDEVVAKVQTQDGEVDVRLAHRWPVRQPRPVARRLAPNRPLVTGQRVIGMFFPVTKGGTARIPGPFGSGKTVVQHQLAKWTDADIIIYVGCGERGNEMTDVLLEFRELKDPRTGRPLMERTVLVANTSNMPV